MKTHRDSCNMQRRATILSIREQEKIMRSQINLEKQRKMQVFAENLGSNLKPFVQTIYPPPKPDRVTEIQNRMERLEKAQNLLTEKQLFRHVDSENSSVNRLKVEMRKQADIIMDRNRH